MKFFIQRKTSIANIWQVLEKKIALRYVEAGCSKITVMDVNTTLLANTAKEIEGKYPGIKALPITVDVGNRHRQNQWLKRES